jgi:uroporphyrinogen decarboxylase
MTPREINLANIEHAGAPRNGFTFDNGRLNDFVTAWFGPANYTQKRWREGSLEYYDDQWGNVWVRMADGCAKGEIHKPVLESWDQLETLRIPHYDVEACAEQARRVFADDRQDRLKVVGIGGWIFDNARYLRKMEVYFLDLAMYPEEVRAMHEKVAEVYEAKIHAAGSSGADAIMIGEDMGTQQGLLFSPRMFRDYFKELYTRLMALAHEYGLKILMHSCGQNWEIIDDLIDCGVNAFQFDQPAVYDMPALAAKLRERKVALWAPLDIQQFLPTGDRQLIERETERMVELFNGGLILKNYPDLPGIGVEREWDMWFYNRALQLNGLPTSVD